MTTNSMTTIPLAIGAGVAGLAVKGGHWCLDRMIRSPMGSTAFVLVTGLTLMAGTNALFLQQMRHPAPMFASFETVAVAAPVAPPPVRPVVVAPAETAPARAEVPQVAPRPVAVETTAPISIGNADIAELQEKLRAMGLFDGTVDGYYGPKTADAIRAFEQRNGLPRTGAASPQVVEAVRRATVNTSQVQPVPAPVEPAPAVAAPVVAEAPAQDELNALIAGLEAPIDAPQSEAPVATVALFDPAVAAPVPDTSTPAPATAVPAALDRDLVSEIQRGLSRLGFLQAPVNGIADAPTALAIRKFQVFNNFPATGEVSTAVLDMLVAAGAYR